MQQSECYTAIANLTALDLTLSTPHCNYKSVQHRHSAVNMTLHAFAAAIRPQVSSDVSCLLGAQQQTCCTLEMLAIDGTDEHSTIS